MSVESLLRTTQTGGQLELAAGGSWTSGSADEIERLVDEIIRQKPRIATIDLGNVRELDTFGAWLVERLVRGVRDGTEARLVGVAERFSGLLAKVRQLNRRLPAPLPCSRLAEWIVRYRRKAPSAGACARCWS